MIREVFSGVHRKSTTFLLAVWCGLCLAGCSGGKSAGESPFDPSEVAAIESLPRSRDRAKAYKKLILEKSGETPPETVRAQPSRTKRGR
jgi:hypothetical protein